jgi:hypothetical protein
MSSLASWLQQEIQSGRLHRKRPFREWQVRFGRQPDGSIRHTPKRLWAYSSQHRWVWNYRNEYQAYQELSTDREEIRRLLGRSSRGQRLLGEIDVATMIGSNRDVNARMRHYLLEGIRPFGFGGALSRVGRQLTEEARLIMIGAIVGGAGSFGAASPYALVETASLAHTLAGSPLSD